MQALVAIVAIVAVGCGVIVLNGANYHALVRSAVVAELGNSALPYLRSPEIIRDVTRAYSGRIPVAVTAAAITSLVRNAEAYG